MYEFFEHTADLGLRVKAANRERLFEDAAEGLFAISARPMKGMIEKFDRRLADDFQAVFEKKG